MKIKNTMKVALLASMFASSLTASEVEINLTKGYANDVWYSFTNGVVKSEPKDNWDMAFQIGQKGGILINEQKGVQLWAVPNSTEESWTGAIDTVGMSENWELLHNSLDTWDIGAFNCDKDGFENDGDFGWGAYNMSTHAITGNKIFVMQTASKEFKRVMIESLLSKIYTFKIANFDGTNEKSYEVNKADFPTKNYTYFSIETGTTIDREPESKAWDLVMGKYIDLVVTTFGDKQPYGVTGIRTNKNARVAELFANDAYSLTAPTITTENYKTSITTIGSDWKTFDMTNMVYNVDYQRAYFVTYDSISAESNIIHKIIFKTFDGTSTGKFTFDLNPATSSVNETNIDNSFKIFPTEISNSEMIQISSDGKIENAIAELSNVNGEIVLTKALNTSDAKLQINNISAGMYFLNIKQGNAIVAKSKIIVK